LFDDVGDLTFGSVKLRLQGHYRCLDVGQPLYKLDILDGATADPIGEITFIPQADASTVEALGHAGVELAEAAKGRGSAGDALKALGPLAKRHGLSEFTVVIPNDNAPAITAAQKVLSRVDSGGDHSRYVVTV
jgi:hypothetical protein